MYLMQVWKKTSILKELTIYLFVYEYGFFYFLGLIVEPPLPIPNKIDNANAIVDSKAEEKIDSSSKPQSTECIDDKPLATNE